MKLKAPDVIRYRKGATALMQIEKTDTLRGYRVYEGMHLTGENIIVRDRGCTLATKEELQLWRSYEADRRIL